MPKPCAPSTNSANRVSGAVGVYGVVGRRPAAVAMDGVAALSGGEATDARTFIMVAALLGVSALVGAALPAIRAVRVDPMLALRAE
jgi:hypothetical protein